MALFDTIKEDREKLKGKPFKEKAGYFFDYYKWPVIIVLVLVIWVGAIIWQKATAPDICTGSHPGGAHKHRWVNNKDKNTGELVSPVFCCVIISGIGCFVCDTRQGSFPPACGISG